MRMKAELWTDLCRLASRSPRPGSLGVCLALETGFGRFWIEARVGAVTLEDGEMSQGRSRF